MIWLPSPPIASAFVAAAVCPLTLLLQARGPGRRRLPMHRFLLAAGLSILAMGLLVLVTGGGECADLLAGIVLLLALLLAAYTSWTLVVWGFTLTMLSLIDQHDGFDSVEAWCSAYGGSADIQGFADNRCGLLLRARFALAEPAQELRITARGRVAAVLVSVVRSVFGLANP